MIKVEGNSILSSNFNEDEDVSRSAPNNYVNDALLDQEDDDVQKSIKETLATCYQKDTRGNPAWKNDIGENSPQPVFKRNKPQIRKIVWDLEDDELKDKKKMKITVENDVEQSSSLSHVKIPASSSAERFPLNPSRSKKYPVVSGVSQPKPFRLGLLLVNP